MTTLGRTKASLNDLLRKIKEGESQFPNFQRGWVWDDDHIHDFLVSIASMLIKTYLKPIVLKGRNEEGFYLHADWVHVVGSKA